jgi:hypothetical protein
MNTPIHRPAGTDLMDNPNAAEIDEMLVYCRAVFKAAPLVLR